MFNFYHNIAEWVTFTQHLSLKEECILFRLISKQFYDEAPLPSNEKELIKVLKKMRISSKEDIEIAYSVIDEFFIKTRNGYLNIEYEGKLREIIRKSNSAKKRGEKGGRPRKTKDKVDIDIEVIEKDAQNLEKKLSTCFPFENNNLTNVEKQPITNNPEPITKNQEEKRNNKEKKTTDLVDGDLVQGYRFEPISPGMNFVKFIESYPKKVSDHAKQEAAYQWKFGKHDKDFSKIMRHISERIGVGDWRDMIGTPDDMYIQMPVNFLKKRSYDNEIKKAKDLKTEKQRDEELVAYLFK
jgi:uncharacterized protein YdaU (DUF1376 family)